MCNLPFSDAVFVRYPNGIITHLKCGRNKTICPVTGTWFGEVQPKRFIHHPQLKYTVSQCVKINTADIVWLYMTLCVVVMTILKW